VGVSLDPFAHGVVTHLQRGGDSGDAQALSGQEDDAGTLDDTPGSGMPPTYCLVLCIGYTCSREE
jgi:hypothetical protein